MRKTYEPGAELRALVAEGRAEAAGLGLSMEARIARAAALGLLEQAAGAVLRTWGRDEAEAEHLTALAALGSAHVAARRALRLR